MQKRTEEVRDEKGRWEVGGGALEFGLTVEENLRKEVREELCTEIIEYEFLGYRDVHRELKDGTRTHWVALDFKVLIDPDNVEIGEPDKIEKIMWVTESELPTPMHSQTGMFFENYRDRLV